jgi:hypothetical protein
MMPNDFPELDAKLEELRLELDSEAPLLKPATLSLAEVPEKSKLSDSWACCGKARDLHSTHVESVPSVPKQCKSPPDYKIPLVPEVVFVDVDGVAHILGPEKVLPSGRKVRVPMLKKIAGVLEAIPDRIRSGDRSWKQCVCGERYVGECKRCKPLASAPGCEIPECDPVPSAVNVAPVVVVPPPRPKRLPVHFAVTFPPQLEGCDRELYFYGVGVVEGMPRDAARAKEVLTRLLQWCKTNTDMSEEERTCQCEAVLPFLWVKTSEHFRDYLSDSSKLNLVHVAQDLAKSGVLRKSWIGYLSDWLVGIAPWSERSLPSN